MKRTLTLVSFITILACSPSGDAPLLAGNSITTFQLQINGVMVSGQINQSNSTITFNVIDANLASLTPSITVSQGATISPSPNSPRDFNNIVNYTVTAENGSTQTYSVIVNNTVLSKEKSIAAFLFNIDGVEYEGEIDQTNGTITFNFIGVDIESLTPEITFSERASINPASGIAQNFNDPVIYTVTAENGGQSTYTVVVNNRPLSTERDILSFVVGINDEDIEARIDLDKKEIAFETGSFDITKLKPEIIISENAIISPESGREVDFTSPVTYAVTSESGETSEFIVKINQSFELDIVPHLSGWANDRKAYTGATLRMTTVFFDPGASGVEFYLLDGSNRFNLPISDLSSREYRRFIYYDFNTKLPSDVISGTNYKFVMQLGNLKVETNYVIDILAEEAPKIEGINQNAYSPGDTLIITGENLTPLIAVPSNGSLYLFNPAGQIITSLNDEKTEYQLLLETSGFTYSAFFRYEGDTRTVMFIGPEGRLGERITVNVTE